MTNLNKKTVASTVNEATTHENEIISLEYKENNKWRSHAEDGCALLVIGFLEKYLIAIERDNEFLSAERLCLLCRTEDVRSTCFYYLNYWLALCKVSLTILNKSSEKATFFIFINALSQFDWTSIKKHQFSLTIELTIAKVADFITFHIFDAV